MHKKTQSRLWPQPQAFPCFEAGPDPPNEWLGNDSEDCPMSNREIKRTLPKQYILYQ